MSLEKNVAQHYATSELLKRIDDAITQVGADPENLTIEDLKPVDEFHTGGIEATNALLDQLEITPDMVVVDLGCGLGGTARHIVHRYGSMVHGVDLTEDFVSVGRTLNERLHVNERIKLKVGSVTDIPFDDGLADIAIMFHVGMNIADKKRLFAEASRVLKPGGHFALFDVMRGENDDDLTFPVPWSGVSETSHVDAPEVYRDAATAAGLVLAAERERRQFALDFFARVFEKVAADGPSPLGINLMMGDTAGEKLQNYVANVESGRIAPVEMIFKRP